MGRPDGRCRWNGSGSRWTRAQVVKCLDMAYTAEERCLWAVSWAAVHRGALMRAMQAPGALSGTACCQAHGQSAAGHACHVMQTQALFVPGIPLAHNRLFEYPVCRRRQVAGAKQGACWQGRLASSQRRASLHCAVLYSRRLRCDVSLVSASTGSSGVHDFLVMHRKQAA